MKNSINRAAALLAVSALLAAACGTRLSDDDRALVIAGITGGGGGGGVTQTDGTATGTTSGTTTGTTSGTTTGTSTGSATTGTTSGTTTGTTSGTTTGTSTGTSTSGTGEATTGTTGGTDTRFAPPGGNGGATDVGVTEDSITFYNVVDVNGTIQGLFEDAKDATLAYWAYFASTEGTIYGRQLLQPVFKDAKLQTQENRTAYLEACEKGFAAVGSMSAFEQGAEGPIRDCGIPDIRTAAVSPEIQTLPTVISADAMKPGYVPLSEWTYYKEVVGAEGVQKAGYLWIDNDTTQFQTQQNRDITVQDLGYDWKVERAIGLAETNYASIVTQLKDAQVELVAFQGDAVQALRLGDAMETQEWFPKLFGLQSNTYGKKLLDGLKGKSYQNIYSVAQTGALTEEIASNPELQLYAEWLNRVKPGAQPTGLGEYAWASMKLFIEALKAVGPNLTRAALIEELRKVQGFTANNLIPPQDIKNQIPTDCIIMLKIENDVFKRSEAGTDYRCRPAPGRL